MSNSDRPAPLSLEATKFNLGAAGMFQIHGKTRRGRPPKYQQYWIALAMEKAAQRAQENGKGQNSEAVNAGADNTPQQRVDDGTTKETRLCQQENGAANRTEDLTSDQPQLKRRSNSWPLNENGKDGSIGSANHGNPLFVQKLILRNNSFSGSELREEDFQAAKKFKPNDVPISDRFKTSDALHSPRNDRQFGNEVPFLVASPYKQVTKGIVVQTSEQKSPESQLGSSKDRCFFPRIILNSSGFFKEGGGRFYDSPPLEHGGHVQAVTTEKTEYALDLSSKLQPTEDVRRIMVSADYVSAEIPGQANVRQENRQLLNVVQPWNTGQLPADVQPWNADKMSLEQEHNGYSAQPMVRAFPYSRLAEVSTWTVDEVVQFVSVIPGCHEYAECFRDEDIDGSSLLQLSESHLRNIIQMKLGPSLHLKKALDDLGALGSNAAA